MCYKKQKKQKKPLYNKHEAHPGINDDMQTIVVDQTEDCHPETKDKERLRWDAVTKSVTQERLI